MVTADEFCRTRNISKVDLLKIDVEGFEMGVLEGAVELMKQRPKLALELHVDLLPKAGSSSQEVWQFLADRGMLDDREIRMLSRPNWNNVGVVSCFRELPENGVVNLFMG
jgi:hypothetical protein